MNLKKNVSKSIAVALVGVSMITPILNTVHANEVNMDQSTQQIDTIKDYSIQPRLGGGPSPSAAWTYNRSYTRTLTASQLDRLSAKYQSNINSSTFAAGQYAYNVSLTALGIWGGKPGTITSAIMGIFGKTYHSEIQRSANVIANAASKNKSMTLRVKEYIRPANGAKMILFY